MSDSTSSCDTENNSLLGGNVNSVAMKLLLTQEFNTIPSITSSSNTIVSAGDTNTNTVLSDNCTSSLPFVLSPETMSVNTISQFPHHFNVSGFPPAFICQPFPVYSPEQYFSMIQKQSASKRVKLATETNEQSNSNDSNDLIAEQLNSFKTSLKSSFERNLQKLDVLDRLVQTVTVKGSIQMDSLKGLLEALQICRRLLKELVIEQVDRTATLTLEFKNCLLPELLESIKKFAVVDDTKNELVDKLRKEEDSHLTDLTILSARNKELQKDTRTLKEQHERLQLEYSGALKSAAFEREEHNQFISQLSSILKAEVNTENNCGVLLDEVEILLKEKTELQLTNVLLKDQVQAILIDLESIKSLEITEPSTIDFDLISEMIFSIVNRLTSQFEEIVHERERFYNNSLNTFTRKLDELVQFQSALAHQSLNIRMGLQGQLANSHENSARLRKHCQELTLELNTAATEIDKKRILLQTRDSELVESKRKYEISSEKIRQLEQELSMKNQENRTLGIRIQGLQNDLEEADTKHRHDLTALERKISILETKLNFKENEERKDGKVVDNLLIKTADHNNFINLDPLSSFTTTNKQDDTTVYTNVNGTRTLIDDSISTIPPTAVVATTKKVVITFTGIRDAGKQKDLSKYLIDLGATVHMGADFNDDITHVLAPRGYRSIRVLAASLTGKWIVPLEWVEACNRTGQYVSEQFHGGYCNSTVRPFRFRTLWMSAAFSLTHKSHPTYPTAALRTLLEKLGKARWCETASQADFLLVTDEEKDCNNLVTSNRGGVLITLNNLINMIPINE